MRRGLFFFFFFFFLFAFHFFFQNHWNLFQVYQNGNFLPGKSISHRGKKSGKMTLPPLKNIALTPLPLGLIHHTYIWCKWSVVGSRHFQQFIFKFANFFIFNMLNNVMLCSVHFTSLSFQCLQLHHVQHTHD